MPGENDTLNARQHTAETEDIGEALSLTTSVRDIRHAPRANR